MTPKLSYKPDLRLKGYHDLSIVVLILFLFSAATNPGQIKPFGKLLLEPAEVIPMTVTLAETFNQNWDVPEIGIRPATSPTCNLIQTNRCGLAILPSLPGIGKGKLPLMTAG